MANSKKPASEKKEKFHFLQEFKQFAFQDNLISLATGVVIGTSFKNVSTSLVEDIIMPPLGLLLGRVDFSNLYIGLSRQDFATLADAEAAGAPVIRYGQFISEVIDFSLTALSIYIVLFFILRQRPHKK